MQCGLAREDGELEDVDELVAQRVAEFRVTAPERQRHSSLQEFSDTENSLRRDEGEDVRLLEVDVGGVDDERNALADFVAEPSRERVVTLLGVDERGARDAFFLRIEKDIDVLAGNDVPIEATILDLVLAEPADLRSGRRKSQSYKRQRSEKDARATPADPRRAAASVGIPTESSPRGFPCRGRPASCARWPGDRWNRHSGSRSRR